MTMQAWFVAIFIFSGFGFSLSAVAGEKVKAFGPYEAIDTSPSKMAAAVRATSEYLEDPKCAASYIQSMDFIFLSATSRLQRLWIQLLTHNTLAYHFHAISSAGKPFLVTHTCDLSDSGAETVRLVIPSVDLEKVFPKKP